MNAYFACVNQHDIWLSYLIITRNILAWVDQTKNDFCMGWLRQKWFLHVLIKTIVFLACGDQNAGVSCMCWLRQKWFLQVLINTEWGAFGDNGCLDQYRSNIDKQLDKKSGSPGKQTYVILKHHYTNPLAAVSR